MQRFFISAPTVLLAAPRLDSPAVIFLLRFRVRVAM